MKKNVLITGGAGFIGANFARYFCKLGHDVTVLEKKEADLWRLDAIKSKIKIQHAGLENYQEIENLVMALKPQIILHFAAYGVYPRKQKDIANTINVNVTGTINLVNACSRLPFECFINTGSSDEYGPKQKPAKETDAIHPNNLYAVTKAAATLYCRLMAEKHGLPIVTVRPFMMYGYFEEKDRLIPAIITACLNNSELKLSQPDSVRDFIFIEDAIEAYMKIIPQAENLKGEIFNLAGGKQTSIGQIVKLIKTLAKSDIQPQYGQVVSAHQEPKNWTGDISKISRKLKWKPAHTLKEGLKKDIVWFRENIDLYK